MEHIQISSQIMVESEMSGGKCRKFLLASWFMCFQNPFECLYVILPNPSYGKMMDSKKNHMLMPHVSEAHHWHVVSSLERK